MLCFNATVKGWTWTPEVGDLSPGRWTTRELPTPWNINWWELSQRSSSQHKDKTLPESQQAPAVDASCQTVNKAKTQSCPLADRVPKAIPSPGTVQNTPLESALPFREKRSGYAHKNTQESQQPDNLHKALALPTHWGQTPQITMTLQPIERIYQL